MDRPRGRARTLATVLEEEPDGRSWVDPILYIAHRRVPIDTLVLGMTLNSLHQVMCLQHPGANDL